MKKVYFSISEDTNARLKKLAKSRNITKKELMLEFVLKAFGEDQKTDSSKQGFKLASEL